MDGVASAATIVLRPKFWPLYARRIKPLPPTRSWPGGRLRARAPAPLSRHESSFCTPHYTRLLGCASFLPPPPGRDYRPNGFDQPERPCSLQKPIRGPEQARRGKRKNEPGAALFQSVRHEHCRNRKQSEQGKWIHGFTPAWHARSSRFKPEPPEAVQTGDSFIELSHFACILSQSRSYPTRILVTLKLNRLGEIGLILLSVALIGFVATLVYQGSRVHRLTLAAGSVT